MFTIIHDHNEHKSHLPVISTFPLYIYMKFNEINVREDKEP